MQVGQVDKSKLQYTNAHNITRQRGWLCLHEKRAISDGFNMFYGVRLLKYNIIGHDENHKRALDCEFLRHVSTN